MWRIGYNGGWQKILKASFWLAAKKRGVKEENSGARKHQWHREEQPENLFSLQ